MKKTVSTAPIGVSMCSIGFQTAQKWVEQPDIECPLPTVIETIAHHGFGGIEIWHPHWDQLDTGGRERARQLISRYGLQVPMLSGYYNFTKSSAHAADSLRKGHRVIRQAAELGAQNIRIFTGNHRSADATADQWWRTTRCLQELCDHATEHNIGLCLETHDWNLMDTVEGSLRLLAMVDRANLGLIFQASTFGPSRWFWALQHLAPWVRHVHAPPGDCSLARAPFDYEKQLRYLIDHGFSGFVSLEYMGKEPLRIAREDGAWLIGLSRRLHS